MSTLAITLSILAQMSQLAAEYDNKIDTSSCNSLQLKPGDKNEFECGIHVDISEVDDRIRLRKCKWIEEPKVEKWQDRQPVGSIQGCIKAEGCNFTSQINVSREATTDFGINIDPSLIIENHKKAGHDLGWANLTSSDVFVKNITCAVKPGHQVQVWLTTEMRTIRGRMSMYWTHYDISSGKAVNRSQCLERDGQLTAPVHGNQISDLGDRLECREKPIAQVEVVHYLRNLNRMGPSEQAAAKAAIQAATKTAPPRGMSVLKSAKVGVVTAWARSQCFNIDDEQREYTTTCLACIGFAKSIIFEQFESYGANLRLTDCHVRYEFHEFE